MTVPQAPEDTLREARDTIDRLSRENTELREVNNRAAARVNTLRQETDRMARDNELKTRQLQEARAHIVKIRQGIIDEAEERDWCDEVNNFLRRVDLDPWEKTFKVTFPEITVTLTASCAEDKSHSEIIDEAREMITDDWHTHVGAATVTES
jgi:predicted RNase H-like nuclease (RuvC/YqgF family)